LQTITAHLTIAFTHWSGIPADIQGVFIDTPAGLFEVAEACSGVKFLVAMIALGALVAQVCFKSWRRRALFMAMAVIVPIFANGLRAWGTIYIAQFQGIAFAAGFDHIFYGWVFFAIVMALMLAGAWRFFDRSIDDPFIDADQIMAHPLVRWSERWRLATWPALAAIAAMALGMAGWAALADRLTASTPHQIMLPEPKGWHEVLYRPQVWWEPRAQGANHRLLGRFADGAGHEVEVFYAFYDAQDEHREAGGFGQGALMPDSEWSWLEPGPVDAEGQAEWLMAGGNVKRLAITFYRSGDVLTGSNARLKLANMRDRFLLARNPTMLLILSAEDRPGHPATQSVAAFRKSAGPLGEWMDHIAKLP
jgi:EpsI family protein